MKFIYLFLRINGIKGIKVIRYNFYHGIKELYDTGGIIESVICKVLKISCIVDQKGHNGQRSKPVKTHIFNNL